MADGGRSAAWGLRYQYLRTLEALMDAVEEPRHGIVAVHVEGLPRNDEKAPDSIDYELTDTNGHVVLAVQVKARAPGTEIGAGQVFKALGRLVRDRDAARYELLISANAGKSAKSLMDVLRSGLPAGKARAAIGEILASVSSGRQPNLLRSLDDEHIVRLGRVQVEFDPRDAEEITEQLRSRLREYRNQASAGLGEQSAGLLIGYLVSEVFRRAAEATEATALVSRFRELLLSDGATVARALGKRDWGVVVGALPAVPEVRRADVLAQVQNAFPLKAAGVAVPNCRLTGMSGIGKTSLAAGYVFERADIYDVIFWADAESAMTLASSFSRIYRELRGHDTVVPADPAVLRDYVLSDLSCAAGRWLLILDNCVDLRGTDDWVPRAGGGHVIVTTTDSASPPWASTRVPVTGMAVAQAVELLSGGLGLQAAPDGPQLDLLVRLARELECWPLALKLACAYLCGGYGIDDIPEYLRKMKVPSLRNPDLVPPRYPRPLVQAVELCVQRIRDKMASAEPGVALAAVTALAVLRISAYLSSRQIPIYLVMSVPEVDLGEDAFRTATPVVADDPGLPAADVVRMLRTQSLVAVDEHLPPDGVNHQDSRRYDYTIQVNSVIQEVAQDRFDQDQATGMIIDRLAWHTERWLTAAVDAGAHERALILAAHAAVIDAHASRLERRSDFVAYLRGNLAVVQSRQNKTEEATRLLRAEIDHFRGRAEQHARLLTCQASIQLATVLAAILVEDQAAHVDAPGAADEIVSLLETAYFFVLDFLSVNPEGAAQFTVNIHSALRNLELNDVRHDRLTMLKTATEDIARRLPGTELSHAQQTGQEIVDCMHEHRDVLRAAELARNMLDDLATANTQEGIQLRCHARKILIEALAVQRELDAALAEFDRFIADAQPPSMYVRDFEYLIHNVGLNCAFLGWLGFRLAPDLLSRLLSDDRAELVQRAFPGDGTTRVRLLCGADALHHGDLDVARKCVAEFRVRVGNASRAGESQKWVGWCSIANVLEDALAIEKDRMDGFTRPAARSHEYSGVARYMLLPPHLQLILEQCPFELLPLLSALVVLATGFARSLACRCVPACHLLQGALVHLGLQAEVIAARARIEHANGTVEYVGEFRQTPAVRNNGESDGHAVLWVETVHRLVDPTIMQVQQLYTVTEDNVSFGLPVVIPLPSVDLLSDPVTGMTVGCHRPPLMISWVPQPQWTQAVTPIPGSDLDAGLAYGMLAIAHATLELIQRLQGLRPDMVQMGTRYPILSNLLDGRSRLPGAPSEPPGAFLRICRSSDTSN
jgi:hypothetical protein